MARLSDPDRSRRRRAGRVLAAAAAGATVVVAAILLAAQLSTWFASTGAAYWFDMLRAHLTAAFLVAASVLALLRLRRGAVLALAAAGIGAAGLAGTLRIGTGGDEVVPADCEPLVLATANLYEENCCAEAAAAALAAADADILVTPELPSGPSAMREALARLYPHVARIESGDPRTRALALWRRLPLAPGAVVATAMHPAHVLATVETPGGRRLQVMAVHVGRPDTLLEYGPIRDFERFSDRLDAPLAVLGDFNATPWSGFVRRIAEATGARPVPGLRATWVGGGGATRARVPEWLGLPIDHVMLSPDIALRSIGTFALPGSDHLGLRAGICLP